jgi:hypothetical protein
MNVVEETCVYFLGPPSTVIANNTDWPKIHVCAVKLENQLIIFFQYNLIYIEPGKINNSSDRTFYTVEVLLALRTTTAIY